MPYRLLLIDDDEAMLASMKSILEKNGYQADTAKSGKEGIAKLRNTPNEYGVVVLDYHMTGMNGIETAEAILQITEDLFILIHSGDTEQDAATLPIRAGAAFFIQKAKGAEYFLENVRFFCEQYEKRYLPVQKKSEISDNEKLIAAIGMAGRSNELAKIAKKILEGRIDDKANILIRGENGTGKQLIAEAIHRHSSKKHGEFVDINCSALPSNLVESELFGHERGAFTGADRKKPGLFLKGNHGTLFLDEIGDADPSVQVKLLKAIQSKMIRPVGSNDDIRIDVRIIAATNVNLEEAILQKKFRTDLYYRLNVISFYLPPLRERPQDIEPIVLRSCEIFNRDRGTNKSFTPSAIEILERMIWPGNARELENFVTKVLAQSFLDTITPKELKARLKDQKDGHSIEKRSLTQELDELTKQRLMEALEATTSLREAAKLLDIPFTTFRDHLKRFGLSTERKVM
jgi:DNA-binding NtrC family response regulator